MATRILRTLPPGAAQAFCWPQFGPPVQELEREFLQPLPLGPPDSPGPRDASTAPETAIPLEELEARHSAELEAARQEAFRKGLEEGRRQPAAQLDASLARLARSIEEIAGLKPRLRAEAERELVHIALAIARRILRRELHVDPDAILGLAKAALEKASLREVADIRLHPSHAPAIRAHLARIGAPEAIRIHEDASLEPGAVIVETARGAIDASLETQLDEISRGLADALAGGSS
jgi:flagellar assembly protein FliH